jgi:hypothetical protein
MIGRYINDGILQCKKCDGPLCSRCKGTGFFKIRSQFSWKVISLTAAIIILVVLSL